MQQKWVCNTNQISQDICSLISIKFTFIVIDMTNLTTISRNENCFTIKCIRINCEHFFIAGKKWINTIFYHCICVQSPCCNCMTHLAQRFPLHAIGAKLIYKLLKPFHSVAISWLISERSAAPSLQRVSSWALTSSIFITSRVSSCSTYDETERL